MNITNSIQVLVKCCRLVHFPKRTMCFRSNPSLIIPLWSCKKLVVNSTNYSSFRKTKTVNRHCQVIEDTTTFNLMMQSSNLQVNMNKDDISNFMAVYPLLVDDLCSESTDIPDFNSWFAKVLEYNICGGKMNRGLAVANTYRLLANPDNVHFENVKLSYVLGWCVELLQAYFLIADDLMDNSLTRRGQQCWYRHNNLGTKAFNDAILLEAAVYSLLRKYIGDKAYYGKCLDLFLEISFKTAKGQSLDTSTPCSLDHFTPEHYSNIVKYKTSFYSFCLPIQLAMYMADVTDPLIHKEVEDVLLKIGYLFQAQDDFLDCYGDPEVTGKVGTDIQEGKCTWLFTSALKVANIEQTKLLKTHYGKTKSDQIDIVKKIYSDLKLCDLFKQMESDMHRDISQQIETIAESNMQNVLNVTLHKIWKRSA